MQQLTDGTGLKITATGAGLSTTSGLWMWLGYNHEALASLGVLIGIVVGVIGLVIQAIAFHRREMRETIEHHIRIAEMRGGVRRD